MGEWKRTTIFELAKGIRGVSYKPENLKLIAENSDCMLLRANNIQNDRLSFYDIQILPKKFVNKPQFARKGDIVVCMSNGSKLLVGKNAIYNENDDNYTVGAFCSIFRPINSSNSHFIFYVFQSKKYKKAIDIALSGSAINNITNSTIEKITIYIPISTVEQQKIAEILTIIDEAIAKTRTLIEKYTNIKAGMMQDLLENGIDESGVIRSPKTHEYKNSPLGRIPVEWECKRIDEVMPLQRGHDLPQYKIKHGEFPVACSNGIIAMHNEFTAKAPCVWTGRSGTIGNVFYSDKNCWMHNTSLWVTNFFGNDEKFIFYLLSSFDIKKFLAGTGVPTLNRNDLHYQKVILPKKKDEQQKITKQLVAADEKIQTERDYLAKLQNIKQGLMQDLLTNTVSVDALLSKGEH